VRFVISPSLFEYVVCPLLVAIIGLFARFMWKLAVRETVHVEHADQVQRVANVERVSQGNGDDSGALAALAATLGRSEERLDRVEASLGKAVERIASLERNEGHLIAWIHTLHTGIEDGTIPPMITIPTHIRALLGI
jgi:hypothetical protein